MALVAKSTNQSAAEVADPNRDRFDFLLNPLLYMQRLYKMLCLYYYMCMYIQK